MNNESVISVLAYHEINEVSERGKRSRTMGPSCSIKTKNFREQLEIIRQVGFETLIFKDLLDNNLNAESKTIITFDDGHIGNYLYAYPLLLEQQMRGVFFVTTDFIDNDNMLTWRQLREMCKHGMSIQSHGVSHTPLGTVSDNILRNELIDSKMKIEDELGVEVNTISLPHGSYKKNIKNIAFELGYKFICTSEISYYHHYYDNRKITLVPRVPIEDDCSLAHIKNILYQSSISIGVKNKIQKFKFLVKYIIGINNYRKIYRLIYNIDIRK